MLERKRLAKQYQIVPGDPDLDVELGEGIGGQESGVVDSSTAPVASTLEAEIDNWDEHAEDDWDDEPATGTDSMEGDAVKTPSASSVGDAEPMKKKRAD